MQRHHFDRHARTIIKSISAGDPNDAFSSDDVALIMRVSLQWVTLARTKGYGPPYEQNGRLILYRRGKLIKYLRERQEFFEAIPALIAPPPTWPAKKRQAAG